MIKKKKERLKKKEKEIFNPYKRELKGKVLFESLLAKRNHKYKKELRKKATESEKIVIEIFKRIKLKYDFQKGFYKLTGKYKGYHCIVDFYIPSLHLVLEVDGGYHDTKEQMRKDWFKDKWLREKRKVNVLRIRNEEANNIIEKINKFIHKPEMIRKYCNFNYWEEKYQLFIC